MQDSSGVRFTQLMHYIQRGWAILPLHDVGGMPGGACSCRAGAACRSAGKHPRHEAWQRPENLVRAEGELRTALERWPSSNWGLATGSISGVWAIDLDPKNVTDWPAAVELIRQLDASAGWIQRTGSGGTHWLFTLPPDFVPNNGSGTLPDGFDVRGARRGQDGGGQIVIAPSVSGVGAYAVLHDPGWTGPAPDAVLDAVRPVPPRPRAEPVPLASRDAGAVSGYVVTAVNGEVTRLRAAPVGRRNATAIRTAYRLVELINTGVVDAEGVFDVWWAAGKAHPDPSVHVPDAELTGVWGRAEREIGDRPADLSHVGGPSGWMGGDAILPFAAPGVPLLGGGPSGAGEGGSSYPQAVHGAVDNLRDSGGTSADIAGQGQDIDPVSALLAEMLDVEQLRNITPPQPLINGVLDLDTTAWLIGASGSYKSFVALDFAAHVGLGRPWRGHDVVQGEVVYIVAEGARGMRLRVDAWEREHGPMKGVRFLPRPVQAHDMAAWRVLALACQRVAPALVVIDTQARVTLGLEENSNTDMGRYVAAVDSIRTLTGACVLTVHHTGRNGKDARGASALDGAQDAELKIEKAGQYMINLLTHKQKDQAEEPPIALRLRRSEGGTDPATGRDLSSLVVDHALVVPLLGEPQTKQDIGRRRALLLFQLVYDLLPNGGEGLNRSEIRKMFVAEAEIAALPAANSRAKAWHRAWALLLERGRVMRHGTSQRFAVFPPPDGAADGMLTPNTGGPDDAPPDGWSLMTVVADRALPQDS